MMKIKVMPVLQKDGKDAVFVSLTTRQGGFRAVVAGLENGRAPNNLVGALIGLILPVQRP
jgi:tRNA-binding EMAP/Myf-like protein